MNSLLPDIKVLGRLLLLQSALQVAPNRKGLGEQVCSILGEVPGILTLALFLDKNLISFSPKSPEFLDEWPPAWELVNEYILTDQDSDISNFHTLSIQTTKTVFGYLFIALDDMQAFQTYLPYIENTVNLIALMLENWKNEKELQNEKDFLKAVLDNIEDGIVACNQEGVLSLFNNATRDMHGLPEKSLPASQWAEYYDLYLSDGVTKMGKEDIPLYRAFLGEYCKDLEMVIAPKRGPKRIVVAAGQPLLDDDKNVIGAVVSMHDITDRKIAEEKIKSAYEALELKVEERTNELRQSYENLAQETAERKRVESQLRQAHKMEAIGTISGGIAHDFNNILGIIIGNTELAMEDIPDWNPVQNNLKEIKKASMRAREVVRQLLSFSRKSEHEKRPIKTHAIVTESVHLMRASIPTSIEFRSNIPKNLGTIMADPTQIHQIVMNLCTNAAHAMEENGGILEIGLSEVDLDEEYSTDYFTIKPGRYIQLTVRDTGCGIDPEIRDRVFDPYFTTKDVDKGTGIGLSVVLGIVKDHDGAISVNSEPNKGTTIKVLFPIVDERPVEEFVTSRELPKGNENVLFIDDEKAMAKIGQQILERLGYQVVASTNPVEALEQIRSNPNRFDLIITDMTMPQMTGDKLVKEVFKIKPDMPIILCTGFSEKIDREIAGEIGIRKFIEKPLNKREISIAVRKVLDENDFS